MNNEWYMDCSQWTIPAQRTIRTCQVNHGRRMDHTRQSDRAGHTANVIFVVVVVVVVVGVGVDSEVATDGC